MLTQPSGPMLILFNYCKCKLGVHSLINYPPIHYSNANTKRKWYKKCIEWWTAQKSNPTIEKEEVSHWRWALRFQRPTTSPSRSPSACGLWIISKLSATAPVFRSTCLISEMIPTMVVMDSPSETISKTPN